MTFFRQHEFSLKYSPLITSLYQNHYQNDNQIVHRCYNDENDEVTNEDEERPGGDLPSFCISISKFISNALISFSLLLCNLFLSAAAFLIFSPSGVPLPRSWERLKFCLRFVKSHFCLFSARYFFILSAPLLTPFNSDMLSLRKFTINWRLQSKWQSMWQSKWLSLSLHLQMNNEYLNILHNIIFYQDVTVWHLLTVFGVTVWHLHKLWHGNGTF